MATKKKEEKSYPPTNKFMQLAIDEAKKGIKKGEGGPFGAVIIHSKTKKVIAKSHNLVLKNNDPTAHAEITAIRNATKKLKRFHLEDCELYTTCEPCPMCYSAIYWARIKKVTFGATRADAKAAGFDDAKIYNILKGKQKNNQFKTKQLNKAQCKKPFEEWNKNNKQQY
jgi:guanine deaminase